jgi:dephospho-CoA kinase
MSDQLAGQSGKFIVGVTGNIATGKSAVMHLAAEEGALTIDADKLVHEILDHDAELQTAIAEAFGPEVRRADGRINRRELGKIVFVDAEAMERLEEMVHPAVYEEVGRRLAETDKPLVFIEAIKLLEGKLADSCQQIWVTRCSRQCQLERLRICRGLDTQSAAARIKAQPPQEDKVALADVVVDTNGYMNETEIQFKMAWDRLPESVKILTHPKPAARAAGKSKLRRAPSKTAKKPAPQQVKTRLSKESLGQISIPRPDRQATAAAKAKTKSAAAQEQAVSDHLTDVTVRRARPSDIPSILLLMQKASGGAIKMKRADLLLALSERSYFIGQTGTEVNAVMGWNIDSQVARIDQFYVHPLSAVAETGLVMVEEVEKSAYAHICELIVAFLPYDESAELRQLFDSQGYEELEKDSLPHAWRNAIDESQPEDTFFMIKILRDERLKSA